MAAVVQFIVCVVTYILYPREVTFVTLDIISSLLFDISFNPCVLFAGVPYNVLGCLHVDICFTKLQHPK